MASITLKGDPAQTAGELPAIGSKAPAFSLTAGDLSDKGLEEYGDKVKVLNIVPSLDTSVCATSARTFNQEAVVLENTVIINISADLPFAQGRFCEAEGLEHIESLSTMRSDAFGRDYGIVMVDGPLAGLMARAVLVLDGQNNIVHTELVPEIVQEPDYAAALAAVRSAV